jgi:hypothetical protein
MCHEMLVIQESRDELQACTLMYHDQRLVILAIRFQIDWAQIKWLRSLTCWMTYRSVFTGRPSSSCTRAPCSNALHVSEARTTSEYRVHSYCRQKCVETIRRFGPHLKSSAMSDDSTACVRTARSFCCLCLLVTVHKHLLSVIDLGAYSIRNSARTRPRSYQTSGIPRRTEGPCSSP